MDHKVSWIFIAILMTVANSEAYNDYEYDNENYRENEVITKNITIINKEGTENMIKHLLKNSIVAKAKKNLIMDLLVEQTNFYIIKENLAALKKTTKILDQYYRLRFLKTVNSDILHLEMENGSLYYQNNKGTIYNVENYGREETTNMVMFENPFLVTVNYLNPGYLKVGNITVVTDLIFNKYTVVSHIQKKIFFLGYTDDFGVFFAADFTDLQGDTIVYAEKISIDLDINILTIDQYTGNIYLGVNNKNIYMLELMSFISPVFHLENDL